MFKEYSQFDGLGLAKLIQEREVSAQDVLQAAIQKADDFNPQLNAIIHRFDDRAKQAALNGLPSGIFHGVPMLLKDLTGVYANERMTMGSRGINWIPDFNSDHMQRIINTGVNVFGKTNTPEFGLTITTEPLAFGPSHNPFKAGYSTGGSSGGSASSVATGIVPIATGDDGGGSIRFPSAWCGVFGLKPSRGLNPLTPGYGEVWSGAVAGHVLTRSVRDSAAMLDATAGYSAGSPYCVQKNVESYLAESEKNPKRLKIAVSQTPLVRGTELDPEVKQALGVTAKQLEKLGHYVEFAEPKIDLESFALDFFLVICSHQALTEKMMLKQFGKKAISRFEPETKNMALIGRALWAEELQVLLQRWHEYSMAMGELLSEYDMMLCPTVHTPAVKHGVLASSGFNKVAIAINNSLPFVPLSRIGYKLGLLESLAKPVLSKMAFTMLGNVTGLPAMSVPLHMSSEGLPIGMQFYGKMCDEARMFSLAGQLEREGLFTCQ